MIVEPEYYLPVLPMLLVNGCVGIGTGFSTNIPPFNPSDIIRVLRDRLCGGLTSLKPINLKPWWHGFKGEIQGDASGGWITSGMYSLDDSKRTVTIQELPVGVWTDDYKVFLDELVRESGSGMTNFDDLCTDDEVKFVLYMTKDYYEDVKADPEEFIKVFKLTRTWKTTNMVAFNTDMNIVCYPKVGHILEAYFEPRLAAYEMRRQKEIDRLQAEAVEYDAKARFIRAVLEGSLELRRATDEQILSAMKKHKLPALSGKEEEKGVDAWDYLLRMRMDRVKASAVKEAEEMVAAAEKQLADMKAATPAQLWLKDLEEVETAWSKMVVSREESCCSAGQTRSGGGAKKKIAPKKKAISVASGGS